MLRVKVRKVLVVWSFVCIGTQLHPPIRQEEETMRKVDQRYEAVIYTTHHGEPYQLSFRLPGDIGESYIKELSMEDALGFSIELDELERSIRAKYPGHRDSPYPPTRFASPK